VSTTTFLLCRHGAHLLGHGKIAGRTAVSLSPEGLAQAEDLAARIEHLPIRAIYASPVARAYESALPLAGRLWLEIQTSEPLAEVDFGEWTGKTLDELRPQEPWKQWNAFRSGAGIPGGERMLEIQARVVVEMLRLREKHPEQVVALYSHGDVIRAALAYWLGMPIDLLLRMEIGLASVSVVAIGDYGPWVLCVNQMGQVAMPYPH
jgi:probable phosphoglycerate mutase